MSSETTLAFSSSYSRTARPAARVVRESLAEDQLRWNQFQADNVRQGDGGLLVISSLRIDLIQDDESVLPFRVSGFQSVDGL